MGGRAVDRAEGRSVAVDVVAQHAGVVGRGRPGDLHRVGRVAVACTLAGTEGADVSVERRGTAGAKKASPADQYIDLAKVPPKLCAFRVGRT